LSASGRHRRGLAALAQRELVQEVPHEHGDFLAALAQRRQADP